MRRGKRFSALVCRTLRHQLLLLLFFSIIDPCDTFKRFALVSCFALIKRKLIPWVCREEIFTLHSTTFFLSSSTAATTTQATLRRRMKRFAVMMWESNEVLCDDESVFSMTFNVGDEWMQLRLKFVLTRWRIKKDELKWETLMRVSSPEWVWMKWTYRLTVHWRLEGKCAKFKRLVRCSKLSNRLSLTLQVNASSESLLAERNLHLSSSFMANNSVIKFFNTPRTSPVTFNPLQSQHVAR